MYRMILGLVFILVLLLSAASPLATEPQAAPPTASQGSVKDLVLATDTAGSTSPSIPVLTIDGAIGPALSDYIVRNIRAINLDNQAPAIFITIDTPGGLSSSLREINQQILSSKIPIACLVYPSGARAASAGTYLLYACHVAAMATATTIGAATPVAISSPLPNPVGKDHKPIPACAMQNKIINDAIAYIKSLAQLRKRNAIWAELAVSEAATLTASEALEKNVINLIAQSPEQLLLKLSDPTLNFKDFKLAGNDANILLDYRFPDWRSQFIAAITNPNIAYLLLMVGVYGLLLEVYSPGIGIAGITGAMSLLLGMYALQMLPLNFTGLGLMILGISLISIEAMRPSFGVFGLGGTLAFILGSIFLIDTGQQEFKISRGLIFSTAVVSASFSIFMLGYLWRNRARQVVSGQRLILDTTARVIADFQGTGQVCLGGESWSAYSSEALKKGQLVSVQEIRGLTLLVKRRSQGEMK